MRPRRTTAANGHIFKKTLDKAARCASMRGVWNGSSFSRTARGGVNGAARQLHPWTIFNRRWASLLPDAVGHDPQRD